MPSKLDVRDAPYFSVVMPTFNRGAMIKLAIDSLLRQEFGSWELIIVDDGSSDNTRDVVAEYADDRIRYFYKANEERSIARNFGIDQSRGKVISFLDSDDYLEVDHLSCANQLIESGYVKGVLHLGFSFLESGVSKPQPLPDSADLLRHLLHDNPLSGNALFIRKEFLEGVRFSHSRYAVIGEDWCLWLRLAARYPFYFWPKVTSQVVVHSGRPTSAIDPCLFQIASFEVSKSLENDSIFKQAVGASRFRWFKAYLLMGIGQNYLINYKKDKRRALGFIQRALREDIRTMWSKRFLVCVKKLIGA